MITKKEYKKAKNIVLQYKKENQKMLYIDMGLNCYYEVYFHSIQKNIGCSIYVKKIKLVLLPFSSLKNYVSVTPQNKGNLYIKKQKFMEIKCN